MGMTLVGKANLPEIPDYPQEPETPGSSQALAEHIADPTPHPAYDNIAPGRFVAFLNNGMSKT
jgi:hypothetical protein